MNRLGIGLVVCNALHYWVFRNLARALAKKCSVTWIINPNQGPKGNDADFFESKGIRTISIENADLENFDALVMVSPDAALFSAKKPVFVRAIYGFAKEKWSLSPVNCWYDLILCPGKYAKERLSNRTLCEVVGNPKFDGYSRLNPGPKRRKKTILYLPSHAEASSITTFSKSIDALAGKYEVIVKLHHGLPKECKGLFGRRVRVLDERDDLLPLLKRADVVLSDYSGAVYDALLVKKPVMLLDLPEEQLEKSLVLKGSMMTRLHAILPHTNRPEDVENLIREILASKKLGRIEGNVYRHLFFTPKNASGLAADAIIRLIKERTNRKHQLRKHGERLAAKALNALIRRNGNPLVRKLVKAIINRSVTLPPERS